MTRDDIIRMAREANRYASNQTGDSFEWQGIRDERFATLVAAAEPVAVHQFRKQYCANWYDGHPDHTDGGGPYEERTLYTAPPRREWQSLSEEEIDCWTPEIHPVIRAIEQALKEKNA
jgi:hypothetical protein